MTTQANFVERRERLRVGVMAQLEDITYIILRKHRVGERSGLPDSRNSADHTIK
jgi:hypothetical protein